MESFKSFSFAGGTGGYGIRRRPTAEGRGRFHAVSTSVTIWSSAYRMKRSPTAEVMEKGYAFTPATVTEEPMEKAFSVSEGADGHGSEISTPTHDTWVGSGFGGGYDYQSSETTSETVAIADEKITMQHLNGRLASYLETVRKLEKANSTLELKIREAIEKRGPMEGRDYSKYEAIIMELQARIVDMIKGNERLAIILDITHLATDDFRVKMEYELSMRQTVEAEMAGLRKLLDNTNITCMHLERDIESLNEEVIRLRKNHEMDVAELRAQITQAGVHVAADSPKGQDLTRIMEDMRAQYEKIALKNQEELKARHQSQITEVQVQVTESSTALTEARNVLTKTRLRYQTLDTDLQSALSLKASLEATLRNIEMCYNVEVEKYNAIIVRLQEELNHICNDIQHNSREYENLLNIKVKLEAEIMEYRRLLDGGDFRLDDAVDSDTVQTIVVTLTQILVDGKVVSEGKDIKSSEKVVE